MIPRFPYQPFSTRQTNSPAKLKDALHCIFTSNTQNNHMMMENFQLCQMSREMHLKPISPNPRKQRKRIKVVIRSEKISKRTPFSPEKGLKKDGNKRGLLVVFCRNNWGGLGPAEHHPTPYPISLRFHCKICWIAHLPHPMKTPNITVGHEIMRKYHNYHCLFACVQKYELPSEGKMRVVFLEYRTLTCSRTRRNT